MKKPSSKAMSRLWARQKRAEAKGIFSRGTSTFKLAPAIVVGAQGITTPRIRCA